MFTLPGCIISNYRERLALGEEQNQSSGQRPLYGLRTAGTLLLLVWVPETPKTRLRTALSAPGGISCEQFEDLPLNN